MSIALIFLFTLQEEDTSFFTAPNTTVTEHLVEKLNPAKNQAKREINLPKTKLTRKGQLYLYTNGKEAEDDDHDPSQLKSILNKNLIKKSYSQKWIDDVSQDFTLDPTKILDDKVNRIKKLKLYKYYYLLFSLLI